MENQLTSIEIFVIKKVKELRLKAGMKQRELSRELNLTSSFIFQVEKMNLDVKYNLNHLNEISKILKCSISDFFPSPNLPGDSIEEYYAKHPAIARKYEELQKKPSSSKKN